MDGPASEMPNKAIRCPKSLAIQDQGARDLSFPPRTVQGEIQSTTRTLIRVSFSGARSLSQGPAPPATHLALLVREREQ